MLKGIHHFSFTIRDMDTSLAFYSQTKRFERKKDERVLEYDRALRFTFHAIIPLKENHYYE